MHCDRQGTKTVPISLLSPVCILVIAMLAHDSCCADGSPRRTPEVEYIAPNGQFSSLSGTNRPKNQPCAAFVDRDTISCTLREGETTFIIQLPKNSQSDRFTFLNENAAACGELRIAVSDSLLPADSPKWTEVDGIVPFAHKRLFKLSVLGIETKYVRLSFKVEGHAQESAHILDPFRTPVLATGIDSNFPTLHQKELDFTLATSVGVLWARQK
jgi:hypothetical protein